MNFDAIYNYYERLVFDAIQDTLKNSDKSYSQGDIEDIACIALNRLPSHYVRHTVDTVYFQSDEERLRIEKEVADAVRLAITKVESKPHKDDDMAQSA